MITADYLADLLAQRRFDLSSELAIQDGIEGLLRESEIDFEREPRLGPGDRPDFVVVGGIVVEVKAKRGVFQPRQLERYAKYPQVSAIVLVTNKAMRLAPHVLGKPLRVVNAGRAWL